MRLMQLNINGKFSTPKQFRATLILDKATMTTSNQTPNSRCQEEIKNGVHLLKQGGVVAYPTDTLYGLGADAFNEEALYRVFTVKGRPKDLALPVLVDGWERVRMVAGDLPETAKHLAQRFWPGPLTLVLTKSPDLSYLVTGGRDTVAVRQPDHWVPQQLVSLLGRPITGTSANLSGQPDLLTLDEVRGNLGALVDYIISCGPIPQGVPSTVVDVTGSKPRLLRQGAVPFDEVMRTCT
jgi:L-threonylcarbamoyladenylate synthase